MKITTFRVSNFTELSRLVAAQQSDYSNAVTVTAVDVEFGIVNTFIVADELIHHVCSESPEIVTTDKSVPDLFDKLGLLADKTYNNFDVAIIAM